MSSDEIFLSLRRIDALMLEGSRLARVCNYVYRHYHEPIRLDDVATIASLERVYFCRYFRRTAGVSFSNWLRMVRVARAIRLLRSTPMTVADVALAVGFADSGGLQRSCKRLIGHSPKEIQLDNSSRDADLLSGLEDVR